MNRVIGNVLVYCLLIIAGYANAGQKQVLFICTGNYYRSRFAEALFNQKALDAHLDWHAISRGLNLVPWQFDISKYAKQELVKRGVAKQLMTGRPKRLTKQDLSESDSIILMDEFEHRAVFEKKFPSQAKLNLQYWHIPDTGKLKPPQACVMMSKNIDQLVEQLNCK